MLVVYAKKRVCFILVFVYRVVGKPNCGRAIFEPN